MAYRIVKKEGAKVIKEMLCLQVRDLKYLKFIHSNLSWILIKNPDVLVG